MSGHPLPLIALSKIIHYFQRGYTPAFLGNISTEIGYDLETTEEMLKHLVIHGGLVRELTRDDKIRRNVSPTSVMYEFVEKH